MSNKLTDELKIVIRDEYVHGFMDDTNVRRYPTVDFLAKKHDVPRATLFRHSSGENWQSQKNTVQTKIQQSLDDERIERMLSESKRLDDSAIQIAQAMLGRVGKTLQRAYQEEQSNPSVEAISMQDLREASNVAQNAQKLGKLALGQAQEISKVSADVSNPEAFHAVMEQLDELANAKSQGGSKPLH
tara:strand:+ start:4415 stop:4975 length:561 start_codon:yes stop_codon:yes gene_type:complete